MDGITGNGNSISYTYNADGIRTSKTVNGLTTKYFLHGDRITLEKVGNEERAFWYDGDGNAAAFVIYDSTGKHPYYYMRNGQGDIIGLFDVTGSVVARYTYDSWGKLVSITDESGNDKTNDTSFVGYKNPLRYRGYYYDNETGLYYLQSRYYNPEWGRFLNADGIIGANGDVISNNLFAYCSNNPIMFSDPLGYCKYCGNSYYNAASMSPSAWEQHLRTYSVLGNTIYEEPVSQQQRDFSNCEFSSDDKGYVKGKDRFPATGKPNSKSTLYGPDGQVETERWYGPDGKAVKDRDWTNHKQPKHHPVPHDHDWGIREDGKWGHLPPYPSPGLTIDDRPPGLTLPIGGITIMPLPGSGPVYFPFPSFGFGGGPVLVY